MTAMALTIAALMQAAGWQDLPHADLAGAEVRAIEAVADGSMWLAVPGRGIATVREGALRWIGAGVRVLDRGVADLHEDAEGRIWAAGVGGFAVFDGETWSEASTVAGVAPRVVFDVSEDEGGGTLWLSTTSGAARRAPDGWELVGESDGLPHAVVHATLADGERTWFACRRGLALRTPAGITILFPEVNFRSILRDGRTGELWFGTSDGAYRLDGEVWTRYLRGEAVFPKVVGRDGVVWAGSASSGLLRFDGDRWTRIALPDRLEGAEVFDVAEDADGSIWVATSRGAGRYVPEGATSGGSG